jgi:hypothetical protein
VGVGLGRVLIMSIVLRPTYITKSASLFLDGWWVVLMIRGHFLRYCYRRTTCGKSFRYTVIHESGTYFIHCYTDYTCMMFFLMEIRGTDKFGDASFVRRIVPAPAGCCPL